MKRYLVTGGAGFIGSHIVHALVEQGNQVRVLDNFSTGKVENLADLGGALEVLEGDVRNPDIMRDAVHGVDIVFHKAAFVSVPRSMENPQECYRTNVQATVELYEAARDAGVARVVVASSAAVYGDSDNLPLHESTRLYPCSPYAVSKQVDEIYAALYTKELQLDVVALRYFNVYGPRQRPDSMYAAAIPVFINRLLSSKPVTIFGNGGQTRDLIFVRDVVRANLIASEHAQAPGEVFNICTGLETRIIDLVETLYEIFPDAPEPIFAEPRAGDIYRSIGNPEKAARELEFYAQVDLEKGLQETVAWMKN
ncbi:MAG: NAD-dependent epimerase/dehydratase family protein [Anaerolineales bacterium]|nr:NAD-dependent epimerase/dehydratase family protein [Anaerolineales bacterium]